MKILNLYFDDSRYIYNLWVLSFYGEEELKFNFTFMIFWVILWVLFHLCYSTNKLYCKLYFTYFIQQKIETW